MKINELKDVIVETLSQIDGQSKKEEEQEREFQDREMLSASQIGRASCRERVLRLV